MGTSGKKAFILLAWGWCLMVVLVGTSRADEDDCTGAAVASEGANFGNNDNRGADLVEASCQTNSNSDIWFVYTASCTGTVKLDTNGSSLSPSNDTVLSVYDACAGNELECDDDGGLGLLSALTFGATVNSNYFIRVAGFGTNTGDITLNISVVGDCLIDDVCYLEGALKPGNDCLACMSAVSATSWTPRLQGIACGDPADTQCDNPDACNGAGLCEPNHKPLGTTCLEDGNQCSFDICDTGLCTHPARPFGTVCGTQSDTECDNPNSCDGLGGCLDNFETAGAVCGDQSFDQCDNPNICDGLGGCDPNYEPLGTPCDDTDVCTGNDICDEGDCAGILEPQPPFVEAESSRRVRVTALPGFSLAPVVLRVTSPAWPCLNKFVQATGLLAITPVSQTPAQWATIVVRGKDIIPSTQYDVVAVCATGETAAGSDVTWKWCDLDNDNDVDFNDIGYEVDKFKGLTVPIPFVVLDVAPCFPPDGRIDFRDIGLVVDAFKGLPYPCGDPCTQ